MELKKIEKSEIKNVVEVHKDSFNGFFLTTLGNRFLSLYYDCIRRDNESILLGIYDENILSGFCAATILSKGFNLKLIKNNPLKFLTIGFILLISKPDSLIRLIKNFSKSNPEIIDNGEYSELLSIGISSNYQGKGIGRKLLTELEKELKLKNSSKLSLTTDYNNNNKAIEFYKGLGYTIYYDFIAYPDRKMYRMIKKLK